MSCRIDRGVLIPIALALHAYQNRYRGLVSPMESQPFRIGAALASSGHGGEYLEEKR